MEVLINEEMNSKIEEKNKNQDEQKGAKETENVNMESHP